MKLTTLNYIAIYLSPVYYLVYYFPTIDIGMMVGVIVSLLLSGVLLREEERERLNRLVYSLLCIGVVYFIFRLGNGILNVLQVLNPSYLTVKLGTYLLSTFIYLIITVLQFWKLLKIAALPGAVKGNGK